MNNVLDTMLLFILKWKKPSLSKKGWMTPDQSRPMQSDEIFFNLYFLQFLCFYRQCQANSVLLRSNIASSRKPSFTNTHQPGLRALTLYYIATLCQSLSHHLYFICFLFPAPRSTWQVVKTNKETVKKELRLNEWIKSWAYCAKISLHNSSILVFWNL